MPVPGHAKPSFSRLSRYDEIGLIWLLAGRPVGALTEATAAIQNSDRRHHHLPQAQQAGARPGGRQPGRPRPLGAAPMTRRCPPEADLQRAVLRHLELVRPRMCTGSMSATAAGARRSRRRCSRALGSAPGAPDLILIRDGKTLGLELKADGGKLTPVQATAHVLMRQAGAEVAVATGIDEALRQLEEWQLLRGRSS